MTQDSSFNHLCYWVSTSVEGAGTAAQSCLFSVPCLATFPYSMFCILVLLLSWVTLCLSCSLRPWDPLPTWPSSCGQLMARQSREFSSKGLFPGLLQGGLECLGAFPCPSNNIDLPISSLLSSPVFSLHTYGKSPSVSVPFILSFLFLGRHRQLVGILVLAQQSGLLPDAVCAPCGCSTQASWSGITG